MGNKFLFITYLNGNLIHKEVYLPTEDSFNGAFISIRDLFYSKVPIQKRNLYIVTTLEGLKIVNKWITEKFGGGDLTNGGTIFIPPFGRIHILEVE